MTIEDAIQRLEDDLTFNPLSEFPEVSRADIRALIAAYRAVTSDEFVNDCNIAAAALERGKIVAWLRAGPLGQPMIDQALAVAILRGDHLTGAKP